MGNDTDRKATQVEPGWRSDGAKMERKATQVDAGWRSESAAAGRKATQVDEGWRGRDGAKGRQATQVDAGWRKEAADMLDPANVMNSATANHFKTIDDFKDAIETLSELNTTVGNAYRVKKTISRAGGESIILLCEDPNGNNVVAKVYYESVNSAGASISARARVLEYMGTEEGKRYTLAVSEFGLVAFGESRYYFEIMPYSPNTDLSNCGALSFEKIVDITKQLNEALHSIHQAGIIHRDIKPENLYDIDGQIKLGDFGIARDGAAGHSKATEFIAGTEGYAAPETSRYIYSEKSDYYSLGVTLASLFEGQFVFENLTAEMQSLLQENEALPLKRSDPYREQLENLLNGLCRISAKQRFGYEDVNRWLKDHDYTGIVEELGWPRPYPLLGESYPNAQSLFNGITKDTKHWEEAKTMLYSNMFADFFRSFRPDLALDAKRADEKYRVGNRDKGLAEFLIKLYAPGPIAWKGYTFNRLSELGSKMVATKNPMTYSELLQNHCISYWLENAEGLKVDENTKHLVKAIEGVSAKHPEIACYWFGNAFAEKTLRICNKQVATIAELITALFSTPKDFYQTDGCRKLLSLVDGADLYGFLSSFGYYELIELAWVNARGCDQFNKITFLISMMDQIAMREGIDPTIIRKFFAEYGPIGIATYTQQLVKRTEDKVYTALDANGKQILKSISEFRAPETGSVEELSNAYKPLMDAIHKLNLNLVENPHCILAGVYDNKGVMCTNLIGCFAFNVFDRAAPLGFHAWLESANGGMI